MTKIKPKRQSTLSIILSQTSNENDITHLIRQLPSHPRMSIEIVVPCTTDISQDNVLVQSPTKEVIFYNTDPDASSLKHRLKGMETASGDYLVFLEPELSLNSLANYEDALLSFKDHGPDIVHFNTQSLNDWGYYSFAENLAPISHLPLEREAILSTWIDSGCRSYILWNKFYSRNLYTRVSSLIHNVDLNKFADFYLTTCLFMLANSYLPITPIVYTLQHLKENRLIDSIDISLDCLKIYQTLPLLFSSTEADITKLTPLKDILLTILTRNMVKVCNSILHSPDGEIDEGNFNLLTARSSEEDIFLLLSLANGFNANRIIDISKIIRWSW